MMLASTCRPGHGLLNTGAFAFSPPPSFNAKDDPLRSTQPTCSSLLHASTSANQNVRNLLLRPPCNGLRKRLYDLATTGATPLLYRRGGLSCLRGGSSAGEESRPASKSDDDGGVNGIPSPTATGGEAGIGGGGGGGRSSVGDIRQQLEGVGLSPNFQRPVEPAATAAAAATSAEFGVALVTERSTATGGSKNRVSYSVLADGTLQVGPPRRRQATTDLVRATRTHLEVYNSSLSIYLVLPVSLVCWIQLVHVYNDR